MNLLALLALVAAPPSFGPADFSLPWGLPYADVLKQFGLTAWVNPAVQVLTLPPKQLGVVSVTRTLFFTGGRLSHAAVQLTCTQWPRKKTDVDCDDALRLFAKAFGLSAGSDGGCVGTFEIGTAEVRLADRTTGTLFVLPVWRPPLPVYEKWPAAGCF